jgi:hypothetical protein
MVVRLSSIAVTLFCKLSAKLSMFFTSLTSNLSIIPLAYCLSSCVELVKFHTRSFALMNPHNGPDNTNNNNNNTRTTKVIAAIPIAGILVGAALLSGLLSVISSETAIAEQHLTGTNATATNATATNATATNATATNATATNATATNATATNATATNATGTSAIETLGG